MSGICQRIPTKGGFEEIETTTWFIEQVHKWFNLMSSRHLVTALSTNNPEPYKAAILISLSVTCSMRVGCGVWKAAQTGFILSTTPMLKMCSQLVESRSYILTSWFTQGCLENPFSYVRLKNLIPAPLELGQT